VRRSPRRHSIEMGSFGGGVPVDRSSRSRVGSFSGAPAVGKSRRRRQGLCGGVFWWRVVGSPSCTWEHLVAQAAPGGNIWWRTPTQAITLGSFGGGQPLWRAGGWDHLVAQGPGRGRASAAGIIWWRKTAQPWDLLVALTSYRGASTITVDRIGFAGVFWWRKRCGFPPLKAPTFPGIIRWRFGNFWWREWGLSVALLGSFGGGSSRSDPLVSQSRQGIGGGAEASPCISSCN
jgi:hypothetical protein